MSFRISLPRPLFLFAFLAIAACATAPAPQEIAASSASAPAAKNDQIVLLIGVDGLRADAIDRFPDAAPNMRRLAAEGVRGSMVPVMPSITFVNFYAIATGLYSEHTGIVSNETYSRSLDRTMRRVDHGQSEWWLGEPIWVTAEKQGVKAGTLFWLGSEAAINGKRPDYWLPYEHTMPFPDRVAKVLEWLSKPEAERPRLVTIYFHAVDSAEHWNGVGSPQERDAIADVDNNIGALIDGVNKLGLGDRLNVIVVADHGMTNVPPGNLVYLDDYISLDDVFIPEFQGPEGAGTDALVHIFTPHGNTDEIYNKLANANPHMRVYRREHLPERWRMNNPDRTGDIVAVADEGWLLWQHKLPSRYGEDAKPPFGNHGYDRHAPDMLATFIGEGPRFRDGVYAETFDNVEIYGMIADILGVKPAKTDGDIDRVRYLMAPAGEAPGQP
ncbi:MAG: alkaline phosphatase family protein [Parvularculaceae bacterium]